MQKPYDRNNSKMTPLGQIIARQIRETGPITIANFMAEALTHPKHGYYQTQTAFGTEGDFITAPDISQMFGELIALWLADRWQALGEPAPLALIELGPGRGTLLRDILRVAEKIPGFKAALQVHLVEAGKRRRSEQKTVLPTAKWHKDVSTLPSLPSLVIANEFFDALPIHQFEFRDSLWWERGVSLSPETDSFKPCLMPIESNTGLLEQAIRNLPQPKPGDIREACPSGQQIIIELAQHIQSHGGAGLFIDYGYAQSDFGDSFQALKGHKSVDPMAEPGLADLTAHVDFTDLLGCAGHTGVSLYGVETQGRFLKALGIETRATNLSKGKDIATRERLSSEVQRLTAPDQMGDLFKVIAIEAETQWPAPCLPPWTSDKEQA